MHVLIFTGQFGMGHIAAAQAVQEEILRQEPTASVTVLDIVEDCFPQLHRLVYGCFDFTVNYCSGVYNMLNRMAGRYRCTPMKRTMVQKLDQLLYGGSGDLNPAAQLPIYLRLQADHREHPAPLYLHYGSGRPQ